MLIIGKPSALDLPIKGSVGTFEVGSSQDLRPSVRVKYLLTHVGFAIEGDAEERLLQNLRPVREVFQISELEFDELMQRDIDDGRVSTELIPYLLRDHGKVLVKLFPPIIVVVLPTNDHGRPAPRYPKVSTLVESDTSNGVEWYVTRSGEVGSEAFEFRQLKQDGEPLEHDYATLRLNTAKCRLAIVDGQHRAMALLALYRNIKGWPSDARKYQEYYARWAKSELDTHDLSGIKLPVMLITFPDLDGESSDTTKVTEACRSVFLALNKNAKRVSAARNYLLDDSDIVAHLLRGTLRKIKSLDDASSRAVRIWNVELDAEGDKRRLTSAVAMTGVMHLYGLIEFLMLNKVEPGCNTLGHSRQNLWKQKDLSDCVRRLGARDVLGADRADTARRNYVDDETESVLGSLFDVKYGTTILDMFDVLAPFRAISKASNGLEKQLKIDSNGSTYHSILFEGQGQSQVFENYVESLKSIRSEYQEKQHAVPPQIQASHEEFERRSKEVIRLKEQFRRSRDAHFLGMSEEKAEIFSTPLAELFSNTFTTEAFQWAVLITFWGAAEKVLSDSPIVLDEETLAKWFRHYLDSLNKVLDPSGSAANRNRLLSTFYGDVDATDDAKVAKASRTLRKIVVPNELKPEEWPKFRYMFLEIWGSFGKGNFPDPLLAQYVDKHRNELRKLVITSYEERELKREAERLGILSAELEDAKMTEVIHECRKAFCAALRNVGVNITLDQLRAQLAEKAAEPPPDYSADEDE